MLPFSYAHATHPQWRMAAGLVVAQLKAQMALPEHASRPSLALVYITDHYASDADALLEMLRTELPEVKDWAGTVGVGIAVNNAEYFDEPALAVMLCDLAREHYRVFSGAQPLPASFDPHTALVHADGHTPDLSDLLHELSQRLGSGYLFGGLASSRSETVQFSGTQVLRGALSGVAFTEAVSLISRVTQGCEPVTRVNGTRVSARTVTRAQGNLVLELDGESALDVMLDDLQISLDVSPADLPRVIDRVRRVLVGLTDDGDSALTARGSFGPDTRVRHIVGLDPLKRGIAIADLVHEQDSLVFCERHTEAARRDLMRIGAEIRDELEPVPEPEFASSDMPRLDSLDAIHSIAARAHALQAKTASSAKTICGAVYVSCAGRGGPHFGGPSAELQILRHALGDVPLVGFFAGGEIAHRHLYGYTGVLTVFTS